MTRSPFLPPAFQPIITTSPERGPDGSVIAYRAESYLGSAKVSIRAESRLEALLGVRRILFDMLSGNPEPEGRGLLQEPKSDA